MRWSWQAGPIRSTYGDLVLRVHYISSSRLEWHQIQGPEAGSKSEQDFGVARVRDDVFFLWWQEKDSSVLSQVVDFEAGRVDTVWVTPDRQLMAFQGMVRALD
jgi:hypothetical protein